ncbi:hypothetical protein BKA61DRAFT_736546 [Leptodontidium sp. MPI-SDFR-AT-0119]|nr:hypothetical protein BKA61DRAFT_736546 [Leptodontidium sp. MPI-SDFR-AT-0119]
MAPSQQASASSTATAEAATSFHKFSELPKELRLTIWELALPGPRITLKMAHLKQNRCPRVRSDANIDTNQFFDVIPQDTYGGGSHGGFYHRGFRSGCPSPALFYVCKDSFSVASKRYERVFGSIHKIPDTWFDFSRDSLYCDWGSLVFLLQYLDPLELERLYISGEPTSVLPTNKSRRFAKFLIKFPGVQNLTFTKGNEKSMENRNEELSFGDDEALDNLVRDPNFCTCDLQEFLHLDGHMVAANILNAYQNGFTPRRPPH